MEGVFDTDPFDHASGLHVLGEQSSGPADPSRLDDQGIPER
jgi:hypothetical protein